MVRQDLVHGLKNAIERGFPLEKAKQSFISAGYSYEEVEEAANFVSSTSPGGGRGSSIIEKQDTDSYTVPSPAIPNAVLPGQATPTSTPTPPHLQTPQPTQVPNQSFLPNQSNQSQVQSTKPLFNEPKKSKKIIILISILGLLLIILIFTIIFKDKIISWFS
tara:strand:+ start:80 stop:565 length:486 start_codon:yes stop_codon:yes gene_type:complete